MKILPFVTQCYLALPNLKNIQMGKWHLKNNPYNPPEATAMQRNRSAHTAWMKMNQSDNKESSN